MAHICIAKFLLIFFAKQKTIIYEVPGANLNSINHNNQCKIATLKIWLVRKKLVASMQ